MARTAPDGRPLVLIVDEDETARDLYGHWFIDHGFQVACAVGVTGVCWALHRESPQLIVSDLRARDLTFDDLMTRVRCSEATRSIPVIVVTACCESGALEQAKRAGAVATLPKWMAFDRLEAWVSALARATD